MSTNQTSKWLVDSTLFAGLLAAFFVDLTGLELHQWLGIAIAIVSTYHLYLHWDWVRAVSTRLFHKSSPKARFYFSLDLLLLAGILAITFTGLVISSWLNLALSNAELWRFVHIWVSIGTLVLLVVKICAHWRWVVMATRKVFFEPGKPVSKPEAIYFAPARPSMSRREFLMVISLVGATSFIAIHQALNGLSVGAGEIAGVETPAQNSRSQAASRGGLSQACSVQCEKRCSYPGQCRRYVDADDNNRCDLGECA